MRLTPALLELDGLVTNVELTLASIIQGVALYFLTENTRSSIETHNAIGWLYIIAGLVIILIFWSRSIIHTLTLIRWPLEFGHNFLYIACALIEALLFTRVSSPSEWFAFTAIYAIGVWFLFLYDLRLVRPREADLASVASKELYQRIERDQRLNIRFLIPALFLYGVISLICLKVAPRFFVEGQGHAILAAGQLVSLIGYLWYVIGFFNRLAPLVQQRQEERKALAQQSARSL
jgi:Ca2+/Na+ antiporter